MDVLLAADEALGLDPVGACGASDCVKPLAVPRKHDAVCHRPVPFFAAMSGATAPGETVPFLWLAGFVLCYVLHLILHPHAGVMRDAMQWLGRHPAPLLWLMASLMAGYVWDLRTGHMPLREDSLVLSGPWPGAFVPCLEGAWKRFALLFHQAVVPPPILQGQLSGAVVQALISAGGQMWLSCYLIASRHEMADDPTAARKTLARWPTILALALCHLPWWWVQGRDEMAVLRNWLLPEFLLFLAPLPLAAAAGGVDFFRAGAESLRWWRRSWLPMLLFALTALPLLTLLEYCLAMLPTLLPQSRVLLRVLLESTLASTVHAWLFVSAALLLLRDGYLPAGDPDAPTPIPRSCFPPDRAP